MGNPTQYLSLGGKYPRAEGDGVVNGRFMVCGVNIRHYIEQFRVFIPPGSQKISVEINDWLGQSVIAHHGTPVKSGFGQLPIATSVDLKYLKDADLYFPGYAGTGKVLILDDVFASPYLSELGGWLYVKVDADRYAGPEKYTNAVSITVNAAAYNNWYDNTNWQTDVEDIIEYSMGGTGGLDRNPTEYITLHDAYHEVPLNSEGVLPEKYFFNPNRTNASGYIPQFRGFIPPGTIMVEAFIKDGSDQSGSVWGGRKSVARHILLPDSSPEGDMPSNFKIGDYSTLTEMIDHECWSMVGQIGALNIAKESFSPVLDINRAGWLYVKVGVGEDSQFYDTTFVVMVDPVIFNAWWTTYIKDEAGWNTFIEYVETYIPPVPGISVDRAQITANKYAGTATFEVSNTESAIASVAWTAEVSKGATWLSITSGESGTDAGDINVAFDANTGSAERIGKIRVTSPKKTIEVSVIQSNTETKPDPPPEITPAKKVVNAMASRLSSVSQAKKSIMQMITDLVDVQDAVKAVTSGAAKALISGNPVAKTIAHFMENKIAGSFGSYGITSQLGKLTDMKNAMIKEMDFCKTAISMYNQIDMGVTNLVGLDDLSIIPGFDFETFPEGFPLPAGVPAIKYSPDKDNPMSKHMLKLSSDLRMQNRPDDSTNPTISAIGDTICIDGIVHVYCPLADGGNGYYPVGIQEPTDVCENYPLSHVSTETFKSLCDDTIDPV